MTLLIIVTWAFAFGMLLGYLMGQDTQVCPKCRGKLTPAECAGLDGRDTMEGRSKPQRRRFP